MVQKSSEDRDEVLAVGSSMPLFARALLLVAAMIAMLGWCVMACRITSDKHPALDLASHLSWHTWAALSAILLAACYALRAYVGETRIRWRHRLFMALPPWLYLTWVTTPWAMLPFAANDSESKGLKIFSWNVLVLNQSHQQVLTVLRESDADVIAIMELSPEQALVLKPLEEVYPYCLWIPNESSEGIAVLSRIQGTRLTTVDLANEGMPAIEANHRNHRQRKHSNRLHVIPAERDRSEASIEGDHQSPSRKARKPNPPPSLPASAGPIPNKKYPGGAG